MSVTHMYVKYNIEYKGLGNFPSVKGYKWSNEWRQLRKTFSTSDIHGMEYKMYRSIAAELQSFGCRIWCASTPNSLYFRGGIKILRDSNDNITSKLIIFPNRESLFAFQLKWG